MAAFHHAFAAQGHEAFRLTQHFHIQQQGQHAHQHDHGRNHRRHAGLARADGPVQPGRKRIEMHRQAENIGQGELADTVSKNQQGGGEQRRADQWDDNFKGDNPAGCAEDLSTLFHLAVHALQGVANNQDHQRGVMQHHNGHNREVAVSHPVRGLDPHRLQPSRLPADGVVLEKGAPRQGEGPGGQHKGHDKQGGKPLAARDIGAIDQPRQHDAHHQRDGDGAQRHREGVEQRCPEQKIGHARAKGAQQIISGECPFGGTGAAFIAALHQQRVQQYGNDRSQDYPAEQTEQQHGQKVGRLMTDNRQSMAELLPRAVAWVDIRLV